ncbi:hypothetical protein [Streptomyces phytophilus]|uniref:hypothetical protein n=1 Tax=Streptomyces phytophilus TaxID=722715 RepID=UPI0015F0A1DA|nr:hypothetical protein [Streptomyces phytophilus]
MSRNVDAQTQLPEPAEQKLIAFIRQIAEPLGIAGGAGWAHPTQYHLLLAHGRLFTHKPRPADVQKLPDRDCYYNAAKIARAHRDHGLVYAEGYATTNAFPLPHAWCVRPDGVVVDPTGTNLIPPPPI